MLADNIAEFLKKVWTFYGIQIFEKSWLGFPATCTAQSAYWRPSTDSTKINRPGHNIRMY